MLCNMLLKQKLAPCSLAPVVKVIITPFPPLRKKETEGSIYLGEIKMSWFILELLLKLDFFFGNDWINLTQLKQPAFMSFALCDLHELRMVLNAFWKQKTAVTSQPFPIKQQNNQPILFVSSLPVCKAPFPILEVISWRTSSILRCIQCMCKLDGCS